MGRTGSNQDYLGRIGLGTGLDSGRRVVLVGLVVPRERNLGRGNLVGFFYSTRLALLRALVGQKVPTTCGPGWLVGSFHQGPSKLVLGLEIKFTKGPEIFPKKGTNFKPFGTRIGAIGGTPNSIPFFLTTKAGSILKGLFKVLVEDGGPKILTSTGERGGSLPNLGFQEPGYFPFPGRNPEETPEGSWGFEPF